MDQLLADRRELVEALGNCLVEMPRSKAADDALALLRKMAAR